MRYASGAAVVASAATPRRSRRSWRVKAQGGDAEASSPT
jgi:hypothetical protein